MKIFERTALNRAALEIPSIVLDDTICFPAAITPLYITSKNGLKAVDEAMAAQRQIFLSYLPKGSNFGNEVQIAPIGTICRIVQVMKLPNNSSRILIEGIELGSIDSQVHENSTLVSPLILDNTISPEIARLMRACQEQFRRYAALYNKISRDSTSAIEAADSPHRLVDLLAACIPLPYEQRLNLLCQLSAQQRLEELAVILETECELLSLKSDISDRVKKRMEQNQKEYFINEQIRELNKELGREEDDLNGIKELEERLKKLTLPPDYQAKTSSELKRLSRLQAMTPEASIVRTWLELVAGLPWDAEATETPVNLAEAKAILDRDHYDLEGPKERILDYLAVHRLNPKLKAPILCFVGPPGTGKTSLGKSLAQAMNRQFIRISLGGVRDEAEIRGHRRTYVGALPGKIIQNIRKCGSQRPVFLLDEIDKLANDQRGDPASALLEVLDPEQNANFTDHYLELPFDLSGVLFIATANSLQNIPYPLRDRMEIIEIPGYTRYDKLKIAQDFIIPRQLTEHALAANSVKFDPAALALLVDEYTLEAGVRNLDRLVSTIIRKLVRQKLSEAEGEAAVITEQLQKLDCVIDAEQLRSFLKKPHKRQDLIMQNPAVGIANGMAWTEMGGTVMPVEVSVVEGKGEIMITGNLGAVMKESARIALSYLRRQQNKLAIKTEQFTGRDIHIHVPEGATPKDGPSAGITLCLALASVLSDRQIKGGYALTGEITLTGRVLAVGGIREKILAAHRYGLFSIILPEKNRIDCDELPAEIQAELELHFVTHMDEVLELMLLPSHIA